MKSEIRMPKVASRQRPHKARSDGEQNRSASDFEPAMDSGFGIRISFGFRNSGFGF
jgi:hypothetical protein